MLGSLRELLVRPEGGLFAALLPAALVAMLALSQRIGAKAREDLLTAFALGLLAAFPVCIMAMPGQAASDGSFTSALHRALLDAGLLEESCKFLALAWLFARIKPEPALGLQMGLVAGLGFATIENLVYSAHWGGAVSLLRSISAVPCHSFLGVIMAQYLLAFHQPAAKAPRGPRSLQLLKAWLLPAMLHALYDLPLMTRAVTDEDQATSALFVTLVLALLAAWTRYLVAGFAQWHVAAVGAVSRRSPE